MSIPKDFYKKRLEELENLLKKAQSNTSKSLLEEAVELTRHSFLECNRVWKLTNEKGAFYDDARKKFDDALKELNKATNQIRETSKIELLSLDTKQKIITASEAMASDVKHQIDIRVNANRQLRAAIDQCSVELKSTLLELIYKPNSTTFIVDAVESVLAKIVVGLIPYSDQVEMLLDVNVNRRKNQYLSSGDKLLIYLEDYIKVLKAWLLLNEQFEKHVLN